MIGVLLSQYYIAQFNITLKDDLEGINILAGLYTLPNGDRCEIFYSQEKFHTINCSPLGRSFTAFDVSEFTWWKWLIPVISLRNVSCKEAELQSMEWLDSIYHAFNFEELKWGIKSEYLILTLSLQRHTSNCKYQWILKCLSDIWYRT